MTQNTSDGTSQTQTIVAPGAATLSQNQQAATGANQEQTWSSNEKLLSAPSSTNISLQQAQAGQSTSSATASESQSTTFASGSSMRLDLNQQQNQNTTSFLQTESINASVTDPGSTASKPGTLYIYKDGVLQATYDGVTGDVTATEQQNLNTANATDTTELASVDFISGGSRVQLSI